MTAAQELRELNDRDREQLMRLTFGESLEAVMRWWSRRMIDKALLKELRAARKEEHGQDNTRDST